MVTGKVSHTVQNKDISSQTPGQTQRLDMALFRAIARDLLRARTSVCFEANGPHVARVSASQLRGYSLVEGDGTSADSSKLRARRLISKDTRGDRFVTQGDASQEPDAPVSA